MKTCAISLLVLLLLAYLGKAARRIFTCNSGQDVGIKPKSFLLNRKMHWSGGVVPYEMDKEFSAEQVRMIKDNLHVFENVSCVKWKPRAGQRDYVAIQHSHKSGVCSSVVGRRGGKQFLHLSDDCFHVDDGYQGAILHEMMHTLGFVHEQQRLDRNCYVQVLAKAAEQSPPDFAVTLETSTSFPYDFASLMHYGENGKMKPRENVELGNFDGELTELDKMKLNFMYCGGKSYCELKPPDCKRSREAVEKCVAKTRQEKGFMLHKPK